tara:strand:- start:467 stop:1612 length:1146 start_codon:yes stop_codon:yes gene_type:complete
LIAAVPKEVLPLETRVSATPSSVKELTKAGIIVQVEKDAGLNSYISDNDYKEAGAQIIESTSTLYTNADIILKVQSPKIEEISQFNPGAVSVSFMQTTRATNLVKAMVEKSVTGFSMHLIPRTTLAQKMDALSSQANIAGYKSVLVASGRIGKYMPLLMTAAGTIRPSKVLVLGAGVAGLQAIATAKRLGAQVEAFDVRPIVKEQVESLGAKFIEVEAAIEEGVGEGGYAKETSEDYKLKQQELIHNHIANADVVITTALIPGRPAPLLIPKSMVQDMRPGSVIMDLAAENGGNCELTKKDDIIESNQVIIDGTSNLPATMPIHASELYAKNVAAFLLYTFNDGALNLDLEDEIISGAMFTHQGIITHQPTQEALNQSKDS